MRYLKSGTKQDSKNWEVVFFAGLYLADRLGKWYIFVIVERTLLSTIFLVFTAFKTSASINWVLFASAVIMEWSRRKLATGSVLVMISGAPCSIIVM